MLHTAKPSVVRMFHNLGFVAHQLIGPTYKNSIAQRGKRHKIKNQMEYYKQT